jgi:hypothetical protein
MLINRATISLYNAGVAIGNIIGKCTIYMETRYRPDFQARFYSKTLILHDTYPASEVS